jgi:cellulose synthase (UDP-forming)
MAGGLFKENKYLRMFTLALFVVLALAGLAFSLYILYEAHTVYMYALGLFLLGLSLVSGFFNVFAGFLYYRSYFYDRHLDALKAALKPMRRFPTVAIAMPVYNEDPKLVMRNMLQLTRLNYPKDRVRFYLLDDSTEGGIAAQLKEFAAEHGITYLHRAERNAFKAGNLNNMLKYSKEEFLAVFDYDEYLTNTNFLLDLIPYFHDKDIGYIQTEKSSFGGTFFSDSVNLFDAFFFKFIQPARAFDNTAIFAGSCGIIRRKALDRIGGFPEYVIEDTFLSFESNLHNYKGLYIPKIYAYGRPIRTFSALSKQQWRYNYGDTQFLLYYFKRRTSRFKRASPLWNIDYITHGFGLNYLSVTLILFTIASIMIVFSNLQFVHLSLFQIMSSGSAMIYLEIMGALAVILSFFMPVFLTRVYFKSVTKGLMVFILNFSLAMVRTKAAISAIFNRRPSWQWTRRAQGRKGYLLYSLYSTRYELGFSSLLFALGGMAYLTNNITGSLWLALYGALYTGATFMMYKYG